MEFLLCLAGTILYVERATLGVEGLHADELAGRRTERSRSRSALPATQKLLTRSATLPPRVHGLAAVVRQA